MLVYSKASFTLSLLYMKTIIFDRLPTFLQRITDYVSRGYSSWQTGEIEPAKAAPLVTKFGNFYGTNRTPMQRVRDRQKGVGAAALLLYQPPESERVRWVLLVTRPELGEHPAHRAETLRDGLQADGRVTIPGYELVRITKPQEPKPVWSWRWPKATEETWRARVVQGIRARAEVDLARTIFLLNRQPGFAGVREQVKRMYALIRSEWKRTRGSLDGLPEIPAAVGYVQRKANPKPRSMVRRKRPAAPPPGAAADSVNPLPASSPPLAADERGPT